MIKTVIFDLGGVIVPFDFDRAYTQMELICGLPSVEIRRRIGATDIAMRLESGQVGSHDFVSELGRMLDCEIEYSNFCQLWTSIFFPHTLIPESLLEAIRKRHRLLLLSNTNSIHFEMIRDSYPLLQHFHHYVLSYEVGAMKPSPRIYQEALRHAQCDPGECFFTDDIPAYVEGARREGIDAVQFEGLEQLRGELLQRGIET
ncbi:MAG: HAD family phosphatase [Acidobacteriia bacterium]|nr:HAD family phosphatase [Terriglobia bacterium]